MRRWIPDTVYNERPWLMMTSGAVLCIGAVLWMIIAAEWSLWQSLGSVLGAWFIIRGAVILLRRQNYRARSKWRRTMQH
jgi:hypothetical protein